MFAPALLLAATITQMLAAPATYDKQHVDVTGTIRDLQTHVSHKGNKYVTFSLCDKTCVHVFSFGSPKLENGQTVTVHGTFAATKHTGSYTFHNEIDADEGSLPH